MYRKLKSLVHKWKIGKLESRESQEVWEADYELIDNEGLFEEYLEMGALSLVLYHLCWDASLMNMLFI